MHDSNLKMLNNISEFEVEVKRFIELHITFDLAHMYVCPEQALFPEYIQQNIYIFRRHRR